MGIILHSKRHYFTRFPFWFGVIVLCGFSPLLIGSAGMWITEMNTGIPCNEGNCYWAIIPWYTLITLPICGLIMIVYLSIIVIDSIELWRENK